MEKLELPVSFFKSKLSDAKTHFERALDCKHTEFDDLYPYMIEHPQFFWYKRYVAWSELLTVVKLCEELGIPDKLSALGVGTDRIDEMAEAAVADPSTSPRVCIEYTYSVSSR